jgi:hypothetical protein
MAPAPIHGDTRFVECRLPFQSVPSQKEAKRFFQTKGNKENEGGIGTDPTPHFTLLRIVIDLVLVLVIEL